MIKSNRIYILFFLLLAGQNSFAQHSRKDSLLQAITITKTDTARISALCMLATEVQETNQDTALKLGRQALVLANKLPGEVAGHGQSLHSQNKIKKVKLVLCNSVLANILMSQQNHDSHVLAFDYLTKALLICDNQVPKQQWCLIIQEFGKNYLFLNEYTKALFYENLALQILQAQPNKKQLGDILATSGIICMRLGNTDRSLDQFKSAQQIYTELKDTNRIVEMEADIAAVFGNRGDFVKCLGSMFHVLKLQEHARNKDLYSTTLWNIAACEANLSNYAEALNYASQSFNLASKRHDDELISKSILLMGALYTNLGILTKAENYTTWALNLNKEQKSKAGLCESYTALGDILKRQGDSAMEKGSINYALENRFPLAHTYCVKGLALAKEIGEKAAISLLLSIIGHIELRLGNQGEAEKNLLQSLALSDSTDQPGAKQTAHEQLFDLYEKKGDYKNAYIHHKLFTAIKDSLTSKDKSIEANKKTMAYEFEMKEAKLKAEQDKKELISQGERIRQRILIYSISSILLLVICLASFIYRNTRQKEKANLMLERKNNTIERQKKEVEDKNKNINDSINYARRIQEAILPARLFEPEEVKDHFIYFSPKDIVSGDFYWRFKDGDDLFIAVVDCTGHGVPGAMMSMLGYDLLEYAVKDKGLREPAFIIQAMNEQLMQKLIKGNNGGSTDGMDMTLCKLNPKTGTLTYAGAKNELCIANNTGMHRCTVDKRSVGYESGFAFTQKTVALQSDEMVFLYTDGYADQKGGPDNGKYLGARFRTLLQGISGLTCAEQKQSLQNEFSDWKKDFEQRDDVLVVGFKL